MKKQDFLTVPLQLPDALVGIKKPPRFSIPLRHGWHPASLHQTPAAEPAGDAVLEQKGRRKPKIKSEPPGAGDREGDKVSIETDIQGNGLGAKWGQGKGGKIWKYCFALRFLPLQAPLLCNVFSYKLPRFSHLRELFLQQPSPASS